MTHKGGGGRVAVRGGRSWRCEARGGGNVRVRMAGNMLVTRKKLPLVFWSPDE